VGTIATLETNAPADNKPAASNAFTEFARILNKGFLII